MLAIFLLDGIWNIESPPFPRDMVRLTLRIVILVAAAGALVVYVAVDLRSRRRLISAWPSISDAIALERFRELVKLADDMEGYLLSGKTWLPIFAEVWLVFVTLIVGNYVIGVEMQGGETFAGLVLIGFMLSVAPIILAIYIVLSSRFSRAWNRKYESLKKPILES